MKPTNIQEKLDLFADQWSPKKIGELNGQQILLAKIQGEFVFHQHEHEDELFMVLKGQSSGMGQWLSTQVNSTPFQRA